MNLIRRLHDPELRYIRLDPRQEAAHLLAGAMEALWIAPWFAIVLPQARQIPVYGLLAFVVANLLIALLLVRLLDSRGMYENLRQTLFLLLLGLAVLLAAGTVLAPLVGPDTAPVIDENVVEPVQVLTLPPILPILALLGLVWWRGLRLGIVMPTPIRIAFGMRLGILFYLAAAIVPEAQGAVMASLSPFFFCGLLGTSLARAISLRETGGQAVTFGPRWMFFMILAAAVTTLIGFAISAGLSGLDPDAIAGVFQPIFAAVLLVFTVLMTPLFLVIEAIAEAILNAFGGQLMGNFMQTTPFSNVIEGTPQQQTGALQDLFNRLQQFFDLFGGVGGCLTIVVLLIVVAIIVLTLGRRQRAALPQDEEREDLEGDALGGLRGLFQRGLDAMNAMLHAVGQFGLGRDLFAALTIRRAYAQMARLAAKQGYPRPVSQTPYEYQATLLQAFPAVQAEIDAITDAYVRVHYGEVPESADALKRVTDALERIKTTPAPR